MSAFFDLIFILLLAVIVITVLRSVIGVVMKTMTNVLGGAPRNNAPPRRPSVPLSGELKKDPVCGTFIAVSSAIQKRVGGEVYYFCSAECRDKFQG